MGMRQVTPMQAVVGYFDKEIERRKADMLNAVAYVAEQSLIAAREIITYTDRTGNLRSSTGYCIVVDGEVWKKSHFEKVKDGAAGVVDGKSFIDGIVAKHPNGIVLIVVAGMNYAKYVQDYGYDVLDSAELVAERLMSSVFEQLGLK